MPEIGSSGLMSGDGKRGVGHRPQATAPILDSTHFGHGPTSPSSSARRGASVLADAREGSRPLSRERCVACCDCDWPRSVRRHLAMTTRKPRADFDRVASNDNRRKDWCREHSVGLHPTADLLTTYLWSS